MWPGTFLGEPPSRQAAKRGDLNRKIGKFRKGCLLLPDLLIFLLNSLSLGGLAALSLLS
jgi:hypothetical protein